MDKRKFPLGGLEKMFAHQVIKASPQPAACAFG